MTGPDPLLGTILDGRYRVEEHLGVGGMGAVYRAWHLRLETWRAVKVMKAELAHDPAFRERFEREARVIEALHHPHLVTLYDLSQTPEGTLYIVYELVEGQTLAKRVSAGDGLSPEDLALLFGQIADGLAFAHANGVIHRDVSPDNIMIGGSGSAAVAKLLDFGLAKELVPKGTPLTAANLFLGKIGYAAPEQMGFLAKGASLDPRVDVFSLSSVLYQVLAGSLPWTTSSLEGYVHDLLLRPEAALAARIEAEIPPQWRPILTQGLARDRERRTPDMVALRSAIVDASQRSAGATLGRVPAGIDPQETPTLTSPARVEAQRGSARGRRRPRWPWLTAAAIATASLGWWMLFSSRRAVAPTDSRPTASPSVSTTPHTPPLVPTATVAPATAPAGERAIPTAHRPTPMPTPTRVERGPVATPALLGPAPPAELVVRSAPEAEVRLDGEGRGRTPLRLTLPPGRYQLSLLTQDGRRLDETIELSPGQAATRDHRFPESGSLAVSSDPGTWMNVSVDGGPSRQTPTVISRVPAGSHTLRATRPGWEDIALEVEVQEGRTQTIRLTPRRLTATPGESVQK